MNVCVGGFSPLWEQHTHSFRSPSSSIPELQLCLVQLPVCEDACVFKACARLLIHKRLFSTCSHSNHLNRPWVEERGGGGGSATKTLRGEPSLKEAQVDPPPLSRSQPTRRQQEAARAHRDSGGHMFLTICTAASCVQLSHRLSLSPLPPPSRHRRLPVSSLTHTPHTFSALYSAAQLIGVCCD